MRACPQPATHTEQLPTLWTGARERDGIVSGTRGDLIAVHNVDSSFSHHTTAQLRARLKTDVKSMLLKPGALTSET